VPCWLLTKDVMKAALDECHARLTNIMAEPNELRTVFHLPDQGLTHTADPPRGSNAAPWQGDFCIASAAWAAVLDRRFEAYAGYAVQHAMARLNNTSGWPGGSPTAYTIVYKDLATDTYLKDWRGAFDATVPFDSGLKDTSDIYFEDVADLDYPAHTYVGLAMIEQARRHGVSLPNVSTLRDEVLGALQDAYARMPGTRLDFNRCIGR
jgi:hypothetical protein